jgi:hypothetical protein
MAKAKRNNNLKLLIVALGSFILGAFVLYYLINKTNLIPINYQAKYFQIYADEKTPATEVYIDLVRGFKFNYSPVYEFRLGSPISLNDKGKDYISIQLTRGKSRISINGFVPEDHGQINVFDSREPASTLMEYVERRTSTGFEPINKARKFSVGSVAGKEAVIYEFEMTEEIYSALPDQVYGKGTMLPNKIKEEQKAGYKIKVVYFKKGNLIYTIGTDSLEDPARQRAYNTVVNSFKFLY